MQTSIRSACWRAAHLARRERLTPMPVHFLLPEHKWILLKSMWFPCVNVHLSTQTSRAAGRVLRYAMKDDYQTILSTQKTAPNRWDILTEMPSLPSECASRRWACVDPSSDQHYTAGSSAPAGKSTWSSSRTTICHVEQKSKLRD